MKKYWFIASLYNKSFIRSYAIEKDLNFLKVENKKQIHPE